MEVGVALQHAQATVLPPWADHDRLRQDCARIFGYELQKRFNLPQPPSTDSVLHSRLFRAAFDKARLEPAVKLEMLLSAAGIESPSGEADLINASVARTEKLTPLPEDIHHAVAEELGIKIS